MYKWLPNKEIQSTSSFSAVLANPAVDEKQSQFAAGRLQNWIGTSGLLRFRNFLEEDALARIVFRIEGEFVVMIFSGVDDIFGEA